MNRHGLVNKTFKTQPTADNKLAIQEESLSPNAQNDMDNISAELESLFKQQGYSVEVDQYKNIKGLGFYMTISKKKNSPGLCVVSVFYSDDLNKFSVSYRRSVKFFESPEEVIRYVKGLHIVCESMSRKINEDVNSPDYCKDGFDTRFRYMDGICNSCSGSLKSFLDQLGIRYRFDRDKKGNPDLIRLAAKSDVKTWFKILDFLRDNDCYLDKCESRRNAMKLRINESAIYDLKEITGYDKEEIFRDDYYKDLEELWDNADDIDDFIYDCFSEWLDEDFIYEFLTDRVGIDPTGLKDKIHKIYIYWRGEDV